jgi:hypothetical protein
MVKRSTWVLLAILALVVGAYFIFKQGASQNNTITPTPTAETYLITQSDGDLQFIHIVNNEGKTFQMQRDMSKAWVITAPSTGSADMALAGAAETQVGALRIITTLESPPAPDAIGLVNPANTIELGFVNGAIHKIEVGTQTPTASGYYVRFDNGKIYVVSQAGIDALLKLLASPPFPATETPEPTSEPTIIPTILNPSLTP